MKEKNEVGEKIKELRENAGFTVTETARKLQISRQTLNNWEKGKNLPSPELIYQLCDLFNVNPEQLLGKFAMSSRSCTDGDNVAMPCKKNDCGAGASQTCDGINCEKTAAVEEIKRLQAQLEDMKSQTSDINDEVKYMIRRRKIILTAVLAMLCTGVLFVAAFVIVLIAPVLAATGNKSFISSVSFGISSAFDVLLLVGIVFVIAVTGIIAGLIYAKKHPLSREIAKKEN